MLPWYVALAKPHCYIDIGAYIASFACFLQSDHEKQVQRAKEVKVAANSAASGNSIDPALAQSDAATLYKKHDLSLKEGQTIKYVPNQFHAC